MPADAATARAVAARVFFSFMRFMVSDGEVSGKAVLLGVMRL